ncbi:hypothetical protein F2Q70_00002443 [Brassica cretica]|uniref:Uncharacterized protein n=1 Tax=Brassica cretica TaxID=69181 RepID=A0A8S9J482_BRACR|nr:hypothetical protein F2Q70_00002443 [Brassica cretica]
MTISTLLSISAFTLSPSSTKTDLLTPIPTRPFSSSIFPGGLNQNSFIQSQSYSHAVNSPPVALLQMGFSEKKKKTKSSSFLRLLG